MEQGQFLAEESMVRVISAFLQIPRRYTRRAKKDDQWLYSFMEELYLNGDDEKRKECFGDTRESAKEAFNKYWKRKYDSASDITAEAYKSFSSRHPEFPYIHKNHNGEK